MQFAKNIWRLDNEDAENHLYVDLQPVLQLKTIYFQKSKTSNIKIKNENDHLLNIQKLVLNFI